MPIVRDAKRSRWQRTLAVTQTKRDITRARERLLNASVTLQICLISYGNAVSRSVQAAQIHHIGVSEETRRIVARLDGQQHDHVGPNGVRMVLFLYIATIKD